MAVPCIKANEPESHCQGRSREVTSIYDKYRCRNR
jgi:hypothetical protein